MTCSDVAIVEYDKSRFFKIAKNTYKITAEQCARLTGTSGYLLEESSR